MAAPKTVKTYPLNGSLRDFEIPFEYLARKFVVVTLIGQDRKVLVLNTDYRFTQRTILTTTRAWGPADDYQLIEIKRVTSATERLVDFSDGSILRASDLNTATVQALHISEEGRDIATETIGVDNDGQLDARGRQIKNLADAVDDGDAVTLRQEREWAASTLGNRNASEASAVRSEASAVRSEASAVRSEASAARSKENADRVMPENLFRMAFPINPIGESVTEWEGKFVGFVGGQPIPVAPVSDSAQGLRADLAVSGGSGMIGFDAARTYPLNSIGQAVHTAMTGPDSAKVFVDHYGAVGDGVTNDTAAIEAAKAVAIAKGAILTFGNKTYAHTGLDLGTVRHVEWLGTSVLRRISGAGYALDFNRTGAATSYRPQYYGVPVIEGHATSTGGVNMRAVHHANGAFIVRNTPGIAFNVEGNVCSRMWVRISGAAENNVLRPSVGLRLAETSPGNYVSDCHFYVIVENIQGPVAIDLVAAQNVELWGTSEGHYGATVGLRDTAACRNNTLHSLWFEGNGGNDMQIAGSFWTFNNLRAISSRDDGVQNNIEMTGGEGNVFNGGFMRTVNLQSTSKRTHFNGCQFSAHPALGIKGSGTYTRSRCSKDDGTLYPDVIGTEGTFNPTLSGSTVSGSHTYSTRRGYWQIIGMRLYFELRIVLSALDPAIAGPVVISGFPFPSSSNTDRYSHAIVESSGVTLGGTGSTLVARVSPGSTGITLIAFNPSAGTGPVTVGPSALSATSSFIISGSFAL